jgi:hypothetical protein
MAITSQIRSRPAFGEFTIADWKKAGLLVPSAVKPVVTTIEKGLVLKRLGQLQQADIRSLRGSIARSSADAPAPASGLRASSPGPIAHGCRPPAATSASVPELEC